MTVAIALMAKAPRAGEVKTRLAPALGPAGAADLYRCFLEDALERLRTLAGAHPVVAYAPDDGRADFERLTPGFPLLAQRGADLGARLVNVFDDLFAARHGAAVVLGSDLPTLPRAVLDDALTRIASPDVDLVLGPGEDGGYYLVGLRARQPAIFEGIDWSTDRVLAQTLARAQAAGLRTALLPPWFDVDTPEDLARLRRDLETAADSDAPRTRRFLATRSGASGEGEPKGRP